MFELEVWQAPITDNQGNILPGAQITVFNSDDTVATIYDDLGRAPRSNPFTVGTDALARFYAEPGRYRVHAQSGSDIAIYDNVDLSQKAHRDDLASPESDVLIAGIPARNRVISVDSIRALRDLPAAARRADVAVVLGSRTFKWDASVEGDDDTATLLKSGSEGGWVLQLKSNEILKSWYSTFTTGFLQSTIDRLSGVYEFVIDDESDTNLNAIDFKGWNIVSKYGAEITGIPNNVGKCVGVKILGNSLSDFTTEPRLASTQSGVIIAKYNSQSYYVLTKNNEQGDYTAIRMAASAGSDLPPWELIRHRSVFTCYKAFAYQSLAESSGRLVSISGFANRNFTSGNIFAPTGATSGAENAFAVGLRATSIGDAVTFEVTPDKQGRFQLTFLGGGVSSREVNISWPGGEETINTESATSGNIVQCTFSSRLSRPFDVTVTNNDARNLDLIGLNLHYPDQVVGEIEYDSWAYYRLASRDAYVVNEGAQEYAFRDVVLDSFVGSVHGSEVAQIEPEWLIDGSVVADGDFGTVKAGMSAQLRQVTSIAGSLTSRINHRFADSELEIQISLSGALTTTISYLGMCSPQYFNTSDNVRCFDQITYPVYIDTSESEQEYVLPHSNLVTWYNERLNRRVSSWHSIQAEFMNNKGGPSVQTSIGVTSVAKLRTGLNVGSIKELGDMSCVIVHKYY